MLLTSTNWNYIALHMFMVTYLHSLQKKNWEKSSFFVITTVMLLYMDLCCFNNTLLYVLVSEAGIWRCKKRCSKKFFKISIKIPTPESLFCNVAGWRLVTLLKRDSGTGVFLWILKKKLRTRSNVLTDWNQLSIYWKCQFSWHSLKWGPWSETQDAGLKTQYLGPRIRNPWP